MVHKEQNIRIDGKGELIRMERKVMDMRLMYTFINCINYGNKDSVSHCNQVNGRECFKISDYNVWRKNRGDGRGGGVMIMV